MEDILEELQLSPTEIKIYKLLISQGVLKAGDIARKIGAHRRNTYDGIERLISKGLVGYIKENNIKYFQATNPRIILQKLKEKYERFEEIVPSIEQELQRHEQKKETLFFRGKNGLKQVLLDVVSTGEEVCICATSEKVYNILTYFFPKIELLRKEKGIKQRMIFDVNTPQETRDNLKTLSNTQVKFIKNFNSSKAGKYIYGDNVAIILWKEEPFVILIREAEIAKAFREEFELLWNLN
jgi:sugar-specific transcriptional regulator TrmB